MGIGDADELYGNLTVGSCLTERKSGQLCWFCPVMPVLCW